jgi:hypothetical protein
MRAEDIKDKIYFGITGEDNHDWRKKLDWINAHDIKEAAVFLERFEPKEREELRQALLESSLKKVPLVHIRHDTTKAELEFFDKNFQTHCFNIHEKHFNRLDRWEGWWNKLYLEMNYDSEIPQKVRVEEIGGFCIDLAHFRAALAEGSEEAYYVWLRRNNVSFRCNHLGGYSEDKDVDLHWVDDKNEFNYLAELPEYVFGDIIALEVDNGLNQQQEFKEHIITALQKRKDKD